MIQTGSNCSASCGKSRTIWSFRSDETNLKKKKKKLITQTAGSESSVKREKIKKKDGVNTEKLRIVCVYIYISPLGTFFNTQPVQNI